METLHIHHTKTTPSIFFDATKGEFRITGRSIPADATVFFASADKWAETFAATFSGDFMTIEIMLDHLNTGSVRSILTILTRFLRMKSRGIKIIVDWHYEVEDEDIRDKGEEMSLILEHPFKFTSFKYPE
ncbi:MAG: DUF1987 domain-containing protein [Bacteroidetes bacterium]|jgi:hypothetical protein|nr:DUF1987 domain-containing protein [Bacteroidota bacterium]